MHCTCLVSEILLTLREGTEPMALIQACVFQGRSRGLIFSTRGHVLSGSDAWPFCVEGHLVCGEASATTASLNFLSVGHRPQTAHHAESSERGQKTSREAAAAAWMMKEWGGEGGGPASLQMFVEAEAKTEAQLFLSLQFMFVLKGTKK